MDLVLIKTTQYVKYEGFAINGPIDIEQKRRATEDELLDGQTGQK